MSERGRKPIDEKLLGVGDLFAIRFSDGLVFLEVTGWEENTYDPYNEISAISSQNSSGFNRLNDSNGDDILYIEKQKKKVNHVAIGHSPAGLRRYTNYPEGQTRLRTIANLSTPTAGSDYGYVDGNDSPYERPTDAEELFVPPGEHLDFNFYNPTSKEQTPILNIKMREYNVRALDPKKSRNHSAISRVVAPGSPIPIAPAGSIDRQVDYELREYWDTVPISFEQAKQLGGK